MSVVVVLDINGVLGEVTKRRADKRKDYIMLPSGQKFYENPSAITFLSWLKYSGRPVALWTSRLLKNAAPIEALELLADFPFVVKLHGEDCTETRNFHPIKKASVLRKKLPLDMQKAKLMFVDDSPEYVEIDQNSAIYACKTYTTVDPNSSKNLEDIAARIYNYLK